MNTESADKTCTKYRIISKNAFKQYANRSNISNKHAAELRALS